MKLFSERMARTVRFRRLPDIADSLGIFRDQSFGAFVRTKMYQSLVGLDNLMRPFGSIQQTDF